MSNGAREFQLSPTTTWNRCRAHGRLNKHQVAKVGDKLVCNRKPPRTREAPPCGQPVERVPLL